MSLVNTETGELVESLSTDDARRLTDRIRLLAESLADTLDSLGTLIDEARTGSAWLALGYRSWTEYVSTEFAGVLPRLDREPRQELVRDLDSRGMSLRAIAPVVGVSHEQVRKDRDAARVNDLTPAPRVAAGAPWEEEGRTESPFESGASSPAPSPITGIDGRNYPRPQPTDHAARADSAVARYPDLAYYRDEVSDLEHCWRLADKLDDFRARGELEERLSTLRRSIDLDRSKRNGTYVPATAPADIRTCPTCGQSIED